MNRRLFLLSLIALPVFASEDEEAKRKRPKPRPINPPGAPQPRPPEKPREAGHDSRRGRVDEHNRYRR